jgi:hypothetical protein
MSTSTRARQRDREVIDRYTQQPAAMPGSLRAQLEPSFGAVERYALIDLDASLALVETWLALSEARVIMARRRDGHGWHIDTIERWRIRAVHAGSGMSWHTRAASTPTLAPGPSRTRTPSRSRHRWPSTSLPRGGTGSALEMRGFLRTAIR